MANTFLHAPQATLEVHLFCAQTLRVKVERDFEELPPGATPPFASASLLRTSL